MTPVKPADTCTSDQPTHSGAVAEPGATATVHTPDLPRRTLTIKAGGVHRSSTARAGITPALAREGSAAQALPTPLKRLTAGRKELAIAHAGATYVLRVTKANKLILTKDSEETQS